MGIKRKFTPDMKLESFWLNEVEKVDSEVDTMNIVIRELSRIESLLGTTSVILIVNVALSAALLVSVLWLALQTPTGAVDMNQAKSMMGAFKSIIGAK